jgi:DNA helicase II / ATP-dependent DNA helicase PcrA
MIELSRFLAAYQATRRYPPDDSQLEAIEAGPQEGLFIVAGPGTGKTTCLTIRILKLVLVDGIPPAGIIATTFTKKAAAELRSRVLGWGYPLIEHLLADPGLPISAREWLQEVDINQVVTGTIDSICEQVLRDFREPATQPPLLIDEYVSQTLMLREGLFEDRRWEDPDLHALLQEIHSGGGNRWGLNVGRKSDLAHSLWDRRFHDQVDWEAFVAAAPPQERRGREVLTQALDSYARALAERGMVDFTLLEQAVLERLRQGGLEEFTEGIRVLLVDEYQDTNLLQEQIYFELARACGGAFAVVGDDDQSLYRFRGATVELYSQFPERYRAVFGTPPRKVDLATNYRSTRRIIDFVNRVARLDAGYQQVRVEKAPLSPKPGASSGVPVLGMFRPDLETLARDLGGVIRQVFRGDGFLVGRDEGGEEIWIRRNPDGGDVGDCALLSSSPAEARGDRDRLPFLLRGVLEGNEPAIRVFNPRGEVLARLPRIQIFGGLLLECLDPGAGVQQQTSGISPEVAAVFDEWRSVAVDFVEQDPPAGLWDYAIGWTERAPERADEEWPRRVPVLELVYGLGHFFPEFYDDPEGQIYWEVFARQVSACEQIGSFHAKVVTDPADPELSAASVKDLLRNFLAPIASGAVGVNEDLIEAFPRDRLSVLSIHQAKGLEFPLVIVDAGSDYKTRHPGHAFKRFPSGGGPAHRMEDLLRPFTGLGAPRRSAVDRAFDDLYRQSFVAYSRPQQVLLLVGIDPSRPGGRVENVATGWTRERSAQWGPTSLLMI